MPYRKTSNFKLDGFLGVVLLITFFVGLFFLMTGLFWVLKYAAPALLIAAFIIDRSVVIGYGKWLIGLVKSNPILGIGAILFTVLGYMVVFPFLFAKSLLKRKVKTVKKDMEKKQKGEFVEYEEISSEKNEDAPLELPQIKIRERRRTSDYDNLFE